MVIELLEKNSSLSTDLIIKVLENKYYNNTDTQKLIYRL